MATDTPAQERAADLIAAVKLFKEITETEREIERRNAEHQARMSEIQATLQSQQRELADYNLTQRDMELLRAALESELASRQQGGGSTSRSASRSTRAQKSVGPLPEENSVLAKLHKSTAKMPSKVAEELGGEFTTAAVVEVIRKLKAANKVEGRERGRGAGFKLA